MVGTANNMHRQYLFDITVSYVTATPCSPYSMVHQTAVQNIIERINITGYRMQ